MFVHLLLDPDCLKTKMSELRLYCDLLFQQVQTIQSQHTADTDAMPASEVTHPLFNPNLFYELQLLVKHLLLQWDYSCLNCE